MLTEIAGSVGSQAAEELSIAIHEDWQLVCGQSDDDRHCTIEASGTTPSASGEALTVQLTGRISPGADPLFIFRTPLDLLISKGIEMRFDGGRPYRLQYRSCHASGCIVPFRLERQLANRFRKGARVTVRLFQVDGDPFDVDISLMGFQAAIAALMEAVKHHR